MTLTDVSSALECVPFFSRFNRKRLRTVVESGKEYKYKPGHTIVKEGTEGVGFHMIPDGKVEVRKGRKILATLSKGQFFGEMSLIDEQPGSADVVTVEPTQCFVLSSSAFSALVKKHPELALLMLMELVKRLRLAQSSPMS
jgi:CRP/FNR family cyclic AMP-dependent transcriptional regulator